MKYVLVALVSTTLLVACNPCKPGAQRCNGMVAEICRSDKKWRPVQDCTKLHRTGGRKFDCAVRQVTPKKQKVFCRPQPTVPTTPKAKRP